MAAIAFRNWKTYQGEAARYDNSQWFRLENTLPDHALWDELNDAEFRAFVWLMCFTSRTEHKTGSLEIDCRTAGRQSGCGAATFQSMVNKLVGLGVVSNAPGELTVQSPCTPGETPAPTITVTSTNTEGAATSAFRENFTNSDLIQTGTQIFADLDPARATENEPPRLVGDPELNAWLTGEMRCTRRGFDSWRKGHAGGDVVRLEAMLRTAEAKWVADERIGQKKAFQRAPPTAWLNTFLEIEAKKYVASPAPPPGGAAVIPLSGQKAETPDEYLARRKRELEAEKANELSLEQRQEILAKHRGKITETG